jgi:hypothetical protein
VTTNSLKAHVTNALLALLLGPWGTLLGHPARRRTDRADG